MAKISMQARWYSIAVRCAIWGASNYHQQLERAYCDFKSWCVANGKRTTIDEFSNKELKIPIAPSLTWT